MEHQKEKEKVLNTEKKDSLDDTNDLQTAITLWKTDIKQSKNLKELNGKMYGDFLAVYDETIDKLKLILNVPVHDVDTSVYVPTIKIDSNTFQVRKKCRDPNIKCMLKGQKNTINWVPNVLVTCMPDPLAWYITEYKHFDLHLVLRKTN